MLYNKLIISNVTCALFDDEYLFDKFIHFDLKSWVDKNLNPF